MYNNDAVKEIKYLKNICHQYLEKYIESTLKVKNDKKHYHKQKKKAYHRLAQELRTDAFKCHFGNMNTVEELEQALNILQNWI